MFKFFSRKRANAVHIPTRTLVIGENGIVAVWR